MPGLGSLRKYGFVYFLSFPGLYFLTIFLSPHQRHKVMTISCNFVQSGVFIFMNLRIGEFFKDSRAQAKLKEDNILPNGYVHVAISESESLSD
jgi:hypothetical protein